MITIEDNKLIIEISHPAPADFKNDLKEALIATMQHQDPNCIINLNETNCTLLELLKYL